MTVHNKQYLHTVQAAEDLSAQAARFRAITLGGTLVAANAAAGTSQRAAGLLASSCRSGEYASYIYKGLAKAQAGAAINTLGFPVMVGSSGYLFAAVSGGLHVGRAYSLAASGDLFEAIVDFATLPTWNGL